jgi:AraC-like DNA-binding protein
MEEFIRLAQLPKYKNYTFLAIAHEVGFNSKSTFNLAFKKATEQSPSAYLKSHSI